MISSITRSRYRYIGGDSELVFPGGVPFGNQFSVLFWCRQWLIPASKSFFPLLLTAWLFGLNQGSRTTLEKLAGAAGRCLQPEAAPCVFSMNNWEGCDAISWAASRFSTSMTATRILFYGTKTVKARRLCQVSQVWSFAPDQKPRQGLRFGGKGFEFLCATLLKWAYVSS